MKITDVKWGNFLPPSPICEFSKKILDKFSDASPYNTAQLQNKLISQLLYLLGILEYKFTKIVQMHI